MPKHRNEIAVPGKSADEIYEKLATDIERVLQKIPMGNIEIERDLEAKIVYVNSSMVTAELKCFEEKLAFDAKLSLLAVPFKSQIDEMIERWVKKHLQTDG